MSHSEVRPSTGKASSGRARAPKLVWHDIFAGAALVGAMLCALFFLASCAKQGSGQHAIVYMRDGSQLAGMVTATSPSEITLAGDDKTTHTIPMAQVKSIEYDDAGAQSSDAQASAGNTGGGGAPSGGTRATRASSDRVHEHHYHPTQAEIHTKTYVVPDGTKVAVRTEDTIDSAKAAEGQTYAAEVADDVLDANGDVVIPRGSNAQIVIRSASKGGKIRGASDLVLDLQSISVEGQEYVVSTVDLQQKGRSGVGANKRTAEMTGGGAALGAIIGAIAGGGKGAAIGAGAGAGGGALTQVLTKGGSIKVPSETVLTFQLDKPVKIVQAQ
ncbi:MAG TPA: hypothetical protein VJN89_00750 [Candidatus Acidoferrum sp.]|nr:hypothetical protein [Candidatus Acidoferrum sp.]